MNNIDESIKKLIKVNDIIQLLEDAQEGWVGCLLIVSEIRSWGVLGYVKLPLQGDVYLRVPWGQFGIVGEALLVHPNSVNEENNE